MSKKTKKHTESDSCETTFVEIVGRCNCTHAKRIVTAIPGFEFDKRGEWNVKSFCPDCLKLDNYYVSGKMKADFSASHMIECPGCGLPMHMFKDTRGVFCKNYKCNLYGLAFEIGKVTLKLAGDLLD